MVGVSVISGLDLVKSMAVSTEDLRLRSSALGTFMEAAELWGWLCWGPSLPLESWRLRSRAASSRLTAASSFTLEAAEADDKIASAVISWLRPRLVAWRPSVMLEFRSFSKASNCSWVSWGCLDLIWAALLSPGLPTEAVGAVFRASAEAWESLEGRCWRARCSRSLELSLKSLEQIGQPNGGLSVCCLMWTSNSRSYRRTRSQKPQIHGHSDPSWDAFRWALSLSNSLKDSLQLRSFPPAAPPLAFFELFCREAGNIKDNILKR